MKNSTIKLLESMNQNLSEDISNDVNNTTTDEIDIKKLQKIVKEDGYIGKISNSQWDYIKYLKLTEHVKIELINHNYNDKYDEIKLVFTSQTRYEGPVISLTSDIVNELSDCLNYFESLKSKDIYDKEE